MANQLFIKFKTFILHKFCFVICGMPASLFAILPFVSKTFPCVRNIPLFKMSAYFCDATFPLCYFHLHCSTLLKQWYGRVFCYTNLIMTVTQPILRFINLLIWLYIWFILIKSFNWLCEKFIPLCGKLVIQ